MNLLATDHLSQRALNGPRVGRLAAYAAGRCQQFSVETDNEAFHAYCVDVGLAAVRLLNTASTNWSVVQAPLSAP